jgi:hypothetical protein
MAALQVMVWEWVGGTTTTVPVTNLSFSRHDVASVKYEDRRRERERREMRIVGGIRSSKAWNEVEVEGFLWCKLPKAVIYTVHYGRQLEDVQSGGKPHGTHIR